MHKTLILISVFLFAAGLAVYPKQESRASVALAAIAPLPPAAGTLTDAAAEPAAAPAIVSTAPKKEVIAGAPLQPAQGPLSPERLSIPSIGFNNPIVKVGTNRQGEMDVPSGKTRNVGWYKNGTLPGELGSAVIGAHVFAAFSKLDEVAPGDEIFVTMSDGTTRKFIVAETNVYKLSEMSPDTLFNRNDARRLNLITCAGALTADGSTYTHRLVVSAIAA